jgi:PAS domain S-box-containing protein
MESAENPPDHGANIVSSPLGIHRKSAALRYGTAVAAVIVATLVRKALDPVLQGTVPFSAYYAAVMCTAWYAGLGPALLALFAGVVVADVVFIEPRRSLFTSNLEHQVGLGLYVVVGVLVAVLFESLHSSRRRTELARAELADANRGLQKEVADRRQAERWLLESEQRFRGYFEQGLVGMAMLSPDGATLEVNRRACEMLGCSEDELLETKWTTLVHPDDLAREESQFRRLLDGLAQGYVTDLRFVRANGDIVYAGLSAQRMLKTDGTVDCVLFLIQDRTSRHMAEENA